MVWRCEGLLPAGWAATLLLLLPLVCLLCAGGVGGGHSLEPTVTDCAPREVNYSELASWVGAHSDVTPTREINRRRRRRRRDLLVSDTECSPDNLCHPTARPRVCYYNSDICNGVRDCDSGRDELFCDECLCPYQKLDGVTMNVSASNVRYWLGVNLKGCARACNDVESGCVAFSVNLLSKNQQRCRIFFQSGPFTANNVGGMLYIRNAPSVPRLKQSVQSQSTPQTPQNCSAVGMYSCGSSPPWCLPYTQLCDGIQHCPGKNEELTCEVYPSIYSQLQGKTLGTYSSPLPPVSLAACAYYCLVHSNEHPKCRFFAYRRSSRECLIGCDSCGDVPAILDDPETDYYSVSVGGAAAIVRTILEVGASSSNKKRADFYERFRPSIRELTESLKTLGVSIPSDAPSTAISRLIFQPTQTAGPTTATVVSSVSRPFLQVEQGRRPPNFSVQGNSANSPPGLSTTSNLPNAPSSSLSGATGAPSVLGATPLLPAARLPADCGRRPLGSPAAANTQTRVILSSGSNNRVVGGQRATYGAYPWQAQIQVYSERGHFEHHCGGALIGERLVLTAAHCLRPALARLQVKLGQHDRRDAGEQDEQTFAVENALSHPGYRSDRARGDADDLAVLKLRLRRGRPVAFSAHVQPLCLPSGPPLPEGQNCHVSGWGKTDPTLPDAASSAADVLHGAEVPLVSDTFCGAREVYGERFVPDRMLCAGHVAGGPDACQGDSGGPLACPTGDGRWQLAGIVSFGEGCGGVVKPGVYTRVSFYVSWIQRAVQLL